MIKVSQVEAGGRGGASQRRREDMFWRWISGSFNVSLLSSSGFVQVPLCLHQELLLLILHLCGQFFFFLSVILQAIFLLFPDGRLRAAVFSLLSSAASLLLPSKRSPEFSFSHSPPSSDLQ